MLKSDLPEKLKRIFDEPKPQKPLIIFNKTKELLTALQEAADYNDDLKKLEIVLVQVFELVKKMSSEQWKTFRENRKYFELLKKALYSPGKVDISKCSLLYMKCQNKDENIFASLAQGFRIELSNPARTIAEYFSDPNFHAAIHEPGNQTQTIKKKPVKSNLTVSFFSLTDFGKNILGIKYGDEKDIRDCVHTLRQRYNGLLEKETDRLWSINKIVAAKIENNDNPTTKKEFSTTITTEAKNKISIMGTQSE